MKEKQITSLTSPLKQSTVVVHIIERIKEALINKELKPGDYLPTEAELTKSLGVSKTSVREAIKMLQAMGVVEVKRGHGTFIRRHPGDDLINPMIFQLIMEEGTTKDIVDFRMMFELVFTLMAMERATEDDIKNIRKTLEEFEITIEKELPTAEDDLAFHHTILECTHNPFVIRTGRTILQLFKASIGRSVRDHPRIALEYHKKVFTAFCEKDEQALRKTIIESFEPWKYFVEGGTPE